jgi:hypothetical protein
VATGKKCDWQDRLEEQPATDDVVGGSFEVFSKPEDAAARAEYLTAFAGQGMLSTGYTWVVPDGGGHCPEDRPRAREQVGSRVQEGRPAAARPAFPDAVVAAASYLIHSGWCSRLKAQVLVQDWRIEYNAIRPQQCPGLPDPRPTTRSLDHYPPRTHIAGGPQPGPLMSPGGGASG